LLSYCGPRGFPRPSIDVYLVTAGGVIYREHAQIDTGSDFTIFASGVATNLGLRLPYPRQTAFSGAAGTFQATASFPPDGTVSLFVTDYREFCYLPAPLVGFHPPGPAAANQRSVLGLSGFLEYVELTLRPSPPEVGLEPLAGRGSSTGPFPKGRGLGEFIASLGGSG
jgi:hypothetical protein